MRETDLDRLLATRYDNGADFRATPDGRLRNVRPISTLTALMVMSELKVKSPMKRSRGQPGWS